MYNEWKSDASHLRPFPADRELTTPPSASCCFFHSAAGDAKYLTVWRTWAAAAAIEPHCAVSVSFATEGVDDAAAGRPSETPVEAAAGPVPKRNVLVTDC